MWLLSSVNSRLGEGVSSRKIQSFLDWFSNPKPQRFLHLHRCQPSRSKNIILDYIEWFMPCRHVLTLNIIEEHSKCNIQLIIWHWFIISWNEASQSSKLFYYCYYFYWFINVCYSMLIKCVHVCVCVKKIIYYVKCIEFKTYYLVFLLEPNVFCTITIV